MGDNNTNDDKWVFPMLESLQRHPEIWNLAHPDYKKNTVRKNSWLLVAEEVAAVGPRRTVEVLKKRWETIRDANKKTNNPNKIPTGSAADSVSKSKYAASLSFLNPSSVGRTTFSNLSASNSSATTSNRREMVDDDPDDQQNDRDAQATSSVNDALNTNAASTSSDVTPGGVKRRRSSSISSKASDFEEKILGILSQSVSSKNSIYGDTTIRILDQLTGRKRHRAIGEFLNWVHKYEENADDQIEYYDDASGEEDGDEISGEGND